MDAATDDPAALNAAFAQAQAEDLARLALPGHRARWLFADRLAARGERAEMGFAAWEGPAHLGKFFRWHGRSHFPDPFAEDRIAPLAAASQAADEAILAELGITLPAGLVAKIARYNAQDHLFLRAVPQPPRNRIRVQLDFGAGHGRLAALSFRAPDPDERVQALIAVDAIPSTWFAQALYYRMLGLRVWDYLDHRAADPGPADVAAALASHDVIHLPTWRLDLVPEGAVDMVTCVQVLKELPGALVADLIPIFARVTGRTGAIYIRDHLQFHNPNHMPVDLLVQTAGFDREFAPQLVDRVEIHGLPRIWRKIDAAHFLGEGNR